MKMVQRESIKWSLFIFISLLTFQSFGTSDLQKETHKVLMTVNKNWAGLENEIQHTFTPNSEQELVQLHLLNVVAYLESQSLSYLSQGQRSNRLLNISFLQSYCLLGDFPKNTLTTFRTPIFIDSENTHCAVGYLLKENGLENVALDISKNQLLNYLADIKHPQLSDWQSRSGLSLFELALIQPTYGPPIPVCAAPSPIQWNTVTEEGSRIKQLFENENTMYAISPVDELGLIQEVRTYSSTSMKWTVVGSQITGEILDVLFCNEETYITALLPEEDYPHQLLVLNGRKWEKVAHFNGSINSVQVFQGKLYVLGNFKSVNDSILSNFVVIDKKTITTFSPVGLRNNTFDHIKSSKTSLFLTSNGGVFKFKNDTINYLTNIQYYQYLPHISLDAIEDTLFVTSLNLPGYNAYYDNREHPSYLSNMLYGQDYPYRSIHFTKSSKINGNMMIAGDFKASTLIPQINDERYLVRCADNLSAAWYGEGLLYQYGQSYYPILEKGIVLDFVQLKDKIYILKKDGSISHSSTNLIEEKIMDLKKRGSNI